MSQKDDLVIEVLRAAGHTDAADLASTVIERTRAGKPPAEEPAAVEKPGEAAATGGLQPSGMTMFSSGQAAAQQAAQDAERAHGKAMLDAMNASLTPWHDGGGEAA